MCVKQMLTRARQSLSHPLLLIVAGAVISSYLLPSLTRQWQNHEKELEVKTTLVQEMSETTADFVVALKQSTFGGFGEQQKGTTQAHALNVAWRAFDRRQTVIAAKLRSYFPGSDLGKEWKSYADALGSFLYFLQSTNENFKAKHSAKVERYLGDEGALDALAAKEATAYEVLDAFLAVEKRWYSKKDTLVEQVLDATDSAI
jgi:hypothetical protein